MDSGKELPAGNALISVQKSYVDCRIQALDVIVFIIMFVPYILIN
jgi:hypothetical protein